jgi:hypothetical protein
MAQQLVVGGRLHRSTDRGNDQGGTDADNRLPALIITRSGVAKLTGVVRPNPRIF